MRDTPSGTRTWSRWFCGALPKATEQLRTPRPSSQHKGFIFPRGTEGRRQRVREKGNQPIQWHPPCASQPTAPCPGPRGPQPRGPGPGAALESQFSTVIGTRDWSLLPLLSAQDLRGSEEVYCCQGCPASSLESHEMGRGFQNLQFPLPSTNVQKGQ